MHGEARSDLVSRPAPLCRCAYNCLCSSTLQYNESLFYESSTGSSSTTYDSHSSRSSSSRKLRSFMLEFESNIVESSEVPIRIGLYSDPAGFKIGCVDLMKTSPSWLSTSTGTVTVLFYWILRARQNFLNVSTFLTQALYFWLPHGQTLRQEENLYGIQASQVWRPGGWGFLDAATADSRGRSGERQEEGGDRTRGLLRIEEAPHQRTRTPTGAYEKSSDGTDNSSSDKALLDHQDIPANVTLLQLEPASFLVTEVYQSGRASGIAGVFMLVSMTILFAHRSRNFYICFQPKAEETLRLSVATIVKLLTFKYVAEQHE
eukprot:GHVU01181631.1.p1 GENE.GHVU01181631.1~~GHVU01181631.1.p1  ORF type:complete len:318 (-),score=31.48 GHVU01181631.1:739-1692(-)